MQSTYVDRGTEPDFFYEVRARSTRASSDVESAPRAFIFLNRTCFNGPGA